MTLRSLGQLDEAKQHHEQALHIYENLIKDGQREFLAERADTLMSLGVTLHRKGQFPEAMQRYEQAFDIQNKLISTGRVKYLSSYVRSLQACVELTIGKLKLSSITQESALNSLQALIQKFACTLLAAPSDLRDWHMAAWFELIKLASVLAHIVKPALGEASIPTVETGVALALDWLGLMLRDADPVWLGQLGPELQAKSALLGQLCMELGGNMPANWFLRTQGLRSQRAALAESDDPELLDLYKQWQRLDEVARHLTGLPGNSGLTGTDGAITGGGRSAKSSAQDEQVYQKWMQLNREVQLKRDALKDRLPAKLTLSLEKVKKRLADAGGAVALLMLAEPLQGQGLLLGLLPAQETPDVLDKINIPALRHLTLNFSLAGIRPTMVIPDAIPFEEFHLQQMCELTATTARRTGAGLRLGGVTSALENAPNEKSVPTQAELERQFEHYQTRMREAITPMLEQLRDAGVREVHWVVSGVFHAMPWNQILQPVLQTLGLTFRTFPHLAGWYRSHDVKSELKQAPRWGFLSHSPSAEPAAIRPGNKLEPLLWVPVEVYMSRLLWPYAEELSTDAPQWNPKPPEQEISALFFAGHGDVPNSNVARAGLVLGGGEQGQIRYFRAPQLVHIQTVRKLLLSCCVTGQTKDILAEPLGLVAGAFDYQAGCAMGSLLPIDDFFGMLFSLAFQWALRHAGAQADFSGVFQTVQGQVAHGAWPDGFGNWLEQNLPDAPLARVGVINGPQAHRLRTMLNAQLRAYGLGYCEWAKQHENWGSDLSLLAKSASPAPPPGLQRAVNWYIAHGW